MAKRRSKRAQRQQRRQFWALVLGASLVAACCLLITISERMETPFLPTWSEILQAVGLQEPEPMDSEMQVHVIDVGNADAILVRNQGKNLLIDAGEKGDGDTVVDYLRRHGVERLDIVVATHADSDHIGGMKTVIESLEIGRFIMAYMPAEATPTTKVYQQMLEALATTGLGVTEAKVGASYPLGDAVLEILGPVAEFDENNNQSVITRVTFGGKKFLFMGDAEKEAENALLTAGSDLSADVIKLGHHGSSSSSQKKLLERVGAQVALITCGSGNSYGHPHAETLETLRELGMTAYRSDIYGDIVLTTDGSSLDVQTAKTAAAAAAAA